MINKVSKRPRRCPAVNGESRKTCSEGGSPGSVCEHDTDALSLADIVILTHELSCTIGTVKAGRHKPEQ